MSRVDVHLRDGRVIDVSDLSPELVVTKLRDAGVRQGDIALTIHHLHSLAAFLCAKCGRRSYNPHDIAHRYCGFCHVFVDEAPR